MVDINRKKFLGSLAAVAAVLAVPIELLSQDAGPSGDPHNPWILVSGDTLRVDWKVNPDTGEILTTSAIKNGKRIPVRGDFVTWGPV